MLPSQRQWCTLGRGPRLLTGGVEKCNIVLKDAKTAVEFIMDYMFLSSSVMEHQLFLVTPEPACYKSQVASHRDSDKSMGKMCVLAWMLEKGEKRIACKANWSRLAYMKAQGI